MNRREAAIISAYTGSLVGHFSDLQDYAEELTGERLGVMGVMFMASEIRRLATPDYNKLMKEMED